ncbi:hypothetical protein CC2G_004385 [Coprinopsis cinerea AmutBmut pab1-1]|nr:hypothetical protein CC2G_004385 [Coprinopsis cinerea AmutBmut pab1-1]
MPLWDSQGKRPSTAAKSTTAETYPTLIGRVTDGDLDAIDTVLERWPKFSNDRKTAVCAAVLRHLDAPFPSPSFLNTSERRKTLERSAGALDVFHNLIVSAKADSSESFMNDASRIAIEHLEPIISWHRFTTLRGLHTMSNLLYLLFDLISLTEGLQLALLSSRCAMDALVTFASSSIDLMAHDDLPELFLYLLHHCTTHKVSQRLLFDAILDSPRSSQRRFLANVVSLIDFASIAVAKAPKSGRKPIDLVRFFIFLQATFDNFSKEWKFSPFLLEQGYIAKYLDLVLGDLPRVRRLANRWEDVPPMLDVNLLLATFKWTHFHRAHTSKLIHQVVQGGLLVRAIELLTSARGEADVNVLDTIISHITGYLPFSDRLWTALEFWDDYIDESLVECLMNPEEPGHETWTKFITSVEIQRYVMDAQESCPVTWVSQNMFVTEYY